MEHYMGIDVSNKKLNIHIKSEIEQNFEIENSKKALIKFVRQMKIKPKKYIVGVESTGRLHLIAQEFFVKKGFEFKVLNPILTGNKIAHSIRKKKTDISDAKIITTLLIQGEGNVIKKEDLNKTKRTILRTRKTIVKHKSAIKIMMKDLKKEAKNPQIKDILNSLNKTIKNMEECVKELEKNAAQEKETDTEKLIRTVPGFAQTLSGIVSSEVGDFKRFSSATKFKAYVGIDPKVTQSGGMLRTGKITKRGNPHLREAFYLAAQVARIHDPNLKEFYDKKINEGKHFRVAVCAVARKLCERVFAVVKQGVPYKINC